MKDAVFWDTVLCVFDRLLGGLQFNVLQAVEKVQRSDCNLACMRGPSLFADVLGVQVQVFFCHIF
jgi:hypothetical protein